MSERRNTNTHRLTSLLPSDVKGGLQSTRCKPDEHVVSSSDQSAGNQREFNDFPPSKRPRRDGSQSYGRMREDVSYYGPSVSSREDRDGTSKSSMPPPAPLSRRRELKPPPVLSAPLRSMSDTGEPENDKVGSSMPQGNTVLPPDDESFDRQFYLQEDEGHYVQESKQEMGRFLFTNNKIQARMSARQSALQDDQAAWEENRLVSAGTLSRRSVDGESMEQQERVTLLVHQVKPPFLDGRVSFSTVREAVPTVKDSSSDFAKCAREGSQTLRTIRATREKHAMRNKFWELGGTRMGNVVGVKNERKLTADDKVATTADGEVDYRKTSGFSSHIKGPQEAVSEFAKQKTIRQQREFLPVYSVRDELLNVIRENTVVVIVGETGSGKTTQLTQYLMEEGYCDFGLVGCTQPRRVAAMSVAKRVSDEVMAAAKEQDAFDAEKHKLGGTVGYAIRFEDCTSQHTQIKYMTDGVLLRESLNDPDLNKYSAIVMDEAHERSLNTDVLFGILRKVVARRSDIKLIVTSATLSAEAFRDYFGGAPVYRIPGRTFPVETYFAKSVQEDYVMAAVKQALQIHFNSPPGGKISCTDFV